MKPYKLMCSLFAHTGDVKGLCSSRDNGGFVSVSRDLSAKLWQLNSEGNQYVLAQTINAHKKYVNSVVVVYTVEEYPNGLIITGSNDQTIAIHDIESNKLIAQLKEHDGAVCALYFNNNSKSNLLYSGSFDCFAKVWNLNNLVKSDFKLKPSISIKGHDQTVWSVLGIDKEGALLTASADKSIKHWKLNFSTNSADCLYKYLGHSDCVRGLAFNNTNDREFFSCSNDGNAIQWVLGQTSPLRTIRVTDAFLYSINMVINDTCEPDSCHFITSGEDRSLRIHSVTKNQSILNQTIVLPCQTLWNAICLPNGNILVACSDGSIRAFTQNEKLMATKSEQEDYEKELSQFAIPVKTNQEMSNINLNTLPGIEALLIPGKKEGQTLILNNENEAEVYQWDSGENRWIKIGVAVGSSDAGGGSKQKVNYLGKEYDYVFDIELDDAGHKLKLPYNLSEDPYHAAQKFIHKHELGQHFLDEIALFLIKNTESQCIGSNNQSSTYYDPFTGENRYVPPSGTSSSSSSNNTGFADPFTGSNAYTTNSSNKPTFEDKVKKTTSHTPGSNEFYPHLDYILFDQINVEPIFKKLKEVQSELSSNKNELISDPSNIELLENLISSINDTKLFEEFKDQIDLLFQMIEAWPEAKLFPLIDLARILVLNPNAANYLFKNQKTSVLISKQEEPNSNRYFSILSDLINEKSLVNSMLVVRTICNLFKLLKDLKSSSCQKLLSFLLTERRYLINKLTSLLPNDNKAFQIAFSTLLLNYAILFKNLVNLNENFSASYMTELIIEFVELLNDSTLLKSIINWDSEALFRVLVALGTLLARSDNHLDYSYLLSIAKSLKNAKSICEEIDSKSQKHAEKVAKCANYLIKFLD